MKVLDNKELIAVSGGQMTEEWYYASLLGGATFVYGFSSNFAKAERGPMSALISQSIANSVITASLGYIGGAYLSYISNRNGSIQTPSIIPAPADAGEGVLT